VAIYKTRDAKYLKSHDGRVAEWFKAPVLKTGRGLCSLVSSNLTPSASLRQRANEHRNRMQSRLGHVKIGEARLNDGNSTNKKHADQATAGIGGPLRCAARNLKRWILPVAVFGRSGTK
jgi:hypothetical protein